jgi:hypothetical protein
LSLAITALDALNNIIQGSGGQSDEDVLDSLLADGSVEDFVAGASKAIPYRTDGNGIFPIRVSAIFSFSGLVFLFPVSERGKKTRAEEEVAGPPFFSSESGGIFQLSWQYFCSRSVL